jgi:photosystem II stability/assembly factor-like uncharacterized protein
MHFSTAKYVAVGLLSPLLLGAIWLWGKALSTDISPRQAQSTKKSIELIPVAKRNEYGKYGFSDVAILESGEIWAVGYDEQDPRRMWHSADGGNTWLRVPINSPGFTINAIEFVDSQHGWAVGGKGTVMATPDGGQTWKQVRRPTWAMLEKVSFVNQKFGYVAGSIGTYDRKTDTATAGVEILRTSDGGQTWQRCYRDDTSHTVWAITTLSEMTALTLLDGNRVLRTVDGGKKWHEVLFKLRGPQSIMFTKAGVGWMVGERLFYKSTDKGLTWKTPQGIPCSLLEHDWWSIDFADENIGMAVSEDSAIALTNDGGQTWIDITPNVGEALRGIRLQGQTGIVFGSQRLFRIKEMK